VVVAQAAISLGWPCQRLNWAWRNVWTTCGINAFVPGTTTPSGSGFFQVTTGTTAGNGGFQLDTTGVFQPVVNGPQLCVTGPNTGGTMMRNRCRRMLDVYGNLVFLCKTPAKSGAGPNTGTPDWAPNAGHQPHATNALNLAFVAQDCLTPNTQYPTPTTTCPGLMGWFTVVWNACSFTNGPSAANQATGGGIPNYLTPSSTPTTSLVFAAPYLLCGQSTIPTTPTNLAPNNWPALAPGQWNAKGVTFRTTRCRRALDQFGRTANRCATVPQGGTQDPLRAGREPRHHLAQLQLVSAARPVRGARGRTRGAARAHTT